MRFVSSSHNRDFGWTASVYVCTLARDLSDFYLRSLSERLDTLTSKMCPNGSEGDATPRSVSKSDAEAPELKRELFGAAFAAFR